MSLRSDDLELLKKIHEHLYCENQRELSVPLAGVISRIESKNEDGRKDVCDAKKVVRCRDCEFYAEDSRRCDHPQLDYDIECYDHWLETEPNDFCSYGEERIKW